MSKWKGEVGAKSVTKSLNHYFKYFLKDNCKLRLDNSSTV
jgi:hypothetical protein